MRRSLDLYSNYHVLFDRATNIDLTNADPQIYRFKAINIVTFLPVHEPYPRKKDPSTFPSPQY